MPLPGKDVYASAFICEKVLREADGLLSAIRLVDAFHAKPTTIKLEHPADETVSQFLPIRFNLIVVLASLYQTTLDVAITFKKPNSDIVHVGMPPTKVMIEDGVYGHTINADLSVSAEQEGTFWFEVLVNGAVATAAPLRILHQPRSSYIDDLRKTTPA